eukprot:1335959-Amorphochlora_amoeboformis.AAC.1
MTALETYHESQGWIFDGWIEDNCIHPLVRLERRGNCREPPHEGLVTLGFWARLPDGSRINISKFYLKAGVSIWSTLSERTWAASWIIRLSLCDGNNLVLIDKGNGDLGKTSFKIFRMSHTMRFFYFMCACRRISSLELPFFSSLGFGRLEGEWVDETRAFVLVNLMVIEHMLFAQWPVFTPHPVQVMLVVIMAQHNKWQPLGLEVAQFQVYIPRSKISMIFAHIWNSIQLDSFHDDEDISTESTPAASTQHRLIIAPAA